MSAVRSTSLVARLRWALLPCAGGLYAADAYGERLPWRYRLGWWLFGLLGHLPRSGLWR